MLTWPSLHYFYLRVPSIALLVLLVGSIFMSNTRSSERIRLAHHLVRFIFTSWQIDILILFFFANIRSEKDQANTTHLVDPPTGTLYRSHVGSKPRHTLPNNVRVYRTSCTAVVQARRVVTTASCTEAGARSTRPSRLRPSETVGTVRSFLLVLSGAR